MITALLALSGGAASSPLLINKVGGAYQMRLGGGQVFHQSNQPIRNQRVIQFPDSTTRVVVWTDAQGVQRYAISLDGRNVDKVAEGEYDLLLKYGRFDPLVSIPAVSDPLRARSNNEVFIVQFHSQVLKEYLEAIAGSGATLSYYLPNNAYIVEMDSATYQEVASMPFVRWIGAYQPAYRLESDVRADLEAGRARTQRYNIQTYHYGPAQKNRLVNRIRAIGGTIDQNVPEGYTIQATLTPQQLAQVVTFNEVFFVDRWSPMEQDMNIAREISGANYIETVANYKGQGVRGQVRDGGVRATHTGFQFNPLIVRQNTTDTSHGTNTTGIVFGTGAGNSQGRGMLPEGQGIFISGLATGATRYNQTLALLSGPYFGVFESNSTGSTLTTAYGTESFTMDDILFRMNILICQSQSNAGTQQSRPQAWAKNIVSVGGIKHMNTLATTDDNWTNGASIGPAQDGRIKPDLAHFYDNITCASSSSDTSYTTGFGGTSGATPITCGHFGLLFQMWADGVFGNTVLANTVFDARPWNSTARALMINTATQWAFSGTTHDLTRTHQGWGRADVRSLYDLRNSMFVVDESERLQNLQTKTYKLFVPAGQPAFKATMIYTDPPGTTTATQHRINDLTLKVTAPDNTVYYGNNGLLAGNWSTSGGSPNTIDPVENVFVQNPASGFWTVEVTASQINQDAELTTGPMDADFALVVTGVSTQVGPSSFSLQFANLLSGGLPELQTSNNQRLSFNRAPGDGPVLEVTGTAPTNSIQSLSFKIESKSPQNDGTVAVYLWDYVAGQYVHLGGGFANAGDGVITANVISNASDFVNAGNGEVKAKIAYSGSSKGSRVMNVDVDQVRWTFGY